MPLPTFTPIFRPLLKNRTARYVCFVLCATVRTYSYRPLCTPSSEGLTDRVHLRLFCILYSTPHIGYTVLLHLYQILQWKSQRLRPSLMWHLRTYLLHR